MKIALGQLNPITVMHIVANETFFSLLFRSTGFHNKKERKKRNPS